MKAKMSEFTAALLSSITILLIGLSMMAIVALPIIAVLVRFARICFGWALGG